MSLFGLGILLSITALFEESYHGSLHECQANQLRSALLPGGCAIMPSISTISVDGSKPTKCALLIIASGSSRSMATKIDGASGVAGSTLSSKPALGSKITCKQR